MSYTEHEPSSLHAENPTYAYVNACIDELQRTGLQNVVICPGSRSTPLAMSCANHPGIKTWMHIDERSAAFFALGMAKQLTQPVALVCTSGTAAANFYPAIVEAKLTHVPLLVLTADRPHELRDNGAPQAIDQVHLYGTHVKWFAEVALPEATNAALRYIRTLADRAVALTTAVPAGPVHLNLPFREPLTPGPLADQPLLPIEKRERVAWEGRPNNAPFVQVADALLATPADETLKQIAEQVRTIQRGLIIAGPYDRPALTEPLIQLARTLGYPILADPLSQLRSGPHDHSNIISSYDAFLRLDDFTSQTAPELVVRFGAMPTAKTLLLYLKRYPDCPQIVVNAQGGWNEPTQLAAQFIHADEVAFCEQLQLRLASSEQPVLPDIEQTWLQRWQKADQLTRESLATAIQDFPVLFEGRIFIELAELAELAHLLPEGCTLFAGNSMPVRDMDTFYWGSHTQIRIAGNRGANGIDGVVSSALGYSAYAPGPTILVIGDLSFFHDLNGLLAARFHHLNMIIVLVNNDGGGIFSFLPQAHYAEHFEQLFGTPTGLDFQHAAHLYGATFQRIESWSAFREAVLQGSQNGGLHIVEVPTERESNVAMHRQLWQAMERAFHNQEEL
jgi:2-succinyl-5-enolpyruvyl-6-hydroxy-3-cyclohexene-1-carboxylate synthase